MKVTEANMRTTEKRAPEASGDEDVVLMYPDNQLEKQVHEFGKGQKAFQVLKEAFFSKHQSV